MPQRYEHTGIVREEKKRNALDYADKSKLDVNHNRVEFPAAFIWRIHDATRNRSTIKLSRRQETQRDHTGTGVFIHENPIRAVQFCLAVPAIAGSGVCQIKPPHVLRTWLVAFVKAFLSLTLQ